MKTILIEVSARHIHLSLKDLEKLFGKGYKLKKLKDLSLPGLFAAKETVDIQVGDRKIANFRIVGPLRNETQVEVSITDAVKLKIDPPVRKSGDLVDSPGALLIGPKGRIRIKQGVIVALRHIHCNPTEAKSLSIKNGDVVGVKIKGKRALIFYGVKVRVKKEYKLYAHIDTDEGNAASIMKKGKGILI